MDVDVDVADVGDVTYIGGFSCDSYKSGGKFVTGGCGCGCGWWTKKTQHKTSTCKRHAILIIRNRKGKREKKEGGGKKPNQLV